MTPQSPDSPHSAGEPVYIRMKVVGFEQLNGWEPDEKGKMRNVLKPEVVWLSPIDKAGNVLPDHPVYGFHPSILIHPAKVLEDMKQSLEKKQ